MAEAAKQEKDKIKDQGLEIGAQNLTAERIEAVINLELLLQEVGGEVVVAVGPAPVCAALERNTVQPEFVGVGTPGVDRQLCRSL